jgi:serine/threonine protein kinase
MSQTRILVLMARTKNNPQLQQDKEVETIKEAITRSGGNALCRVIKEAEVTREKLNEILEQDEPHVVHFTGHGDRDRYLFIAGKDGLSEPLPAETVASELRALADAGRRVRCFVLSACYSDRVAAALVEYVDIVVGMTSEIADGSAIAFAAGFYFAVGRGLSAQVAVEAGRNQIRQTSAKKGDWDLPRLRANHLVDSWKYVIARGEQAPTPAQGGLLHGKYALFETLGIGPIAQTDVMEDVQLRRRVVVKTLIQPAARGAFLDEVADLVRVSKHPNIVSIYGSWLNDDKPHYVREYAEGRTLRARLENGGPADRSIDFVHQVLAALAEAMGFAMRAGVVDLGVKPERVLIEERHSGSDRGRPLTYQVLVCPGPGGSHYRRPASPELVQGLGRLYVPPEYGNEKEGPIDFGRANQYRLGVIGYELLVGTTKFEEVARTRGLDSSKRWLSIKEAADRHCPSFLRHAIEKMIDPDPDKRYATFAEAAAAIVHPNLHVEVARDSFARILEKDKEAQWPEKFFHKFYSKLRKLPATREYPALGPAFQHLPDLGDKRDDDWVRQFEALKEAIVFLFAYNLLRKTETGGRSILSRIVDSHHKLKGVVGAHCIPFGETLTDVVVEYDEGAIDRGFLRTAWDEAIRPGLEYLKTNFRSHES